MPARRLLVVHAHPDDETLWTGGMIARYAAAGVAVTLVTCTLGEQGEVLTDELLGLAADRADQLGGYRVAELRAACAALGVTDQRFLGGIGRWRDSGMVVEPGARASTPPDLHPRAFAAGVLYEQVDALLEVLQQVRPQVVVSYGPDGGYGHPDHIRAHQVVMAAVARMSEVARVFWAVHPVSAVAGGIAALRAMPELPFPLPEGLPGVDDSEVTTSLDVTAHRAAVLAAMRAHGTQVKVWTAGGHAAFALCDGAARPVFDTEHFTLVRGPAAGSHDDLFGGLPDPVVEPPDKVLAVNLVARITLVVLVFDAVALAAIELLYLPLRVGAVPLPITILLAAVSTPWLVHSAADLGGPRWVAAVPLVAWVLALGVFGVAGPGGDVLLPADWRAALLLGGGMFPAAVTLGRALATRGSAGVVGPHRVGEDTVQVDGPFGYRE